MSLDNITYRAERLFRQFMALEKANEEELASKLERFEGDYRSELENVVTYYERVIVDITNPERNI